MSREFQKIDSITVIGGGDAGLLTALALDRELDDTDIVTIDDFDESVPEVGKSTLSYVTTFLRDCLGINLGRVIREVSLAWKTTVYFEDWTGIEPFHSPLGQSLPIISNAEDAKGPEIHNLNPYHEDEFHEFYYRYNQRDFTTLYELVAESPGTAPIIIRRDNTSTIEKPLPSAAYHFNSRSLNKFLRTLLRERGGDLIDDHITEVMTSGNRIDRIVGEKTEYSSDLYIDASGFQRILMKELDNPLLKFDLPVDSAVVATPDISYSEIVSATVVTSGEAGWFWQIDTASDTGGARDLGYVYSSMHLSDETAEQEFIETRNENIDPESIRRYRFESGVLETPWLNNCIAIGNALGFVEPLQSTALTTSCKLAARLTRLLGKHGRVNHDGLRRLYNESTRATWEEIYNFISIYYKHNSGSTQFWEDARSINPGKVPHYLSYQDSGFSAWQDRYRLTRNATDLNEYYLYYHIFRNLGVESDFYERLDFEPDSGVANKINEYTTGLPDEMDEFLTYEEFHQVFHPGFD
jgi:tryptophan halogenase